jgi:stalled ribosome rescue protein Dom34
MNKKVGLWISRTKAVIVSIENNIEARRIITSDMGNYVLYSTVVPGDGKPENIRDRRFWNRLNEYYAQIIAYIRDAGEIQVFGPEEAKYELQKHLENEGLAAHIISLEDAGKMTDLEIITRVQNRFPMKSRFDLS